jgi:hypothetical protein
MRRTARSVPKLNALAAAESGAEGCEQAILVNIEGRQSEIFFLRGIVQRKPIRKLLVDEKLKTTPIEYLLVCGLVGKTLIAQGAI